ncbi:MAG: acylneuraminate cytidylyltransferase [Chloroflexi bacterium]|nr:acylneuraminate cytidylyltransferase [Chloroflexota bacterium]|tara:strand:+ start:23052 stop:23792 length:741 start_codon:yes stop_codon:yes gene_type:complete
MKIGIIVQTRMGSTRLPGKVMIKADENNVMLDYSINQLTNCKNHDVIVIATTTLSRDDSIVEFCKNKQVEFFRGDENDVLGRHYLCAKKLSLTHIVRIPSDKPLIDPQIVDSIIKFFISNKLDYAANFGVTKENGFQKLISTYPSGTEVEIFTFDALEYAWKNSKTEDEREHVTPYIYFNPDKFKIKILNLKQNQSHLRWSLDHPSDVLFIREIIKKIHDRPILMQNIINLLEKNPNLIKINQLDS